MIDKSALFNSVIRQLKADHDVALQAATSAHHTATHSESIAENKYDTFGLEASYLAQGQADRAAQIAADLQQLTTLGVRAFSENESIGMGALVALENQDNEASKNRVTWYLLLPAAGGLKMLQGGITVTVVTPASPLGKQLLHRSVDDEISMPASTRINRGMATYLITAIH